MLGGFEPASSVLDRSPADDQVAAQKARGLPRRDPVGRLGERELEALVRAGGERRRRAVDRRRVVAQLDPVDPGAGAVEGHVPEPDPARRELLAGPDHDPVRRGVGGEHVERTGCRDTESAALASFKLLNTPASIQARRTLETNLRAALNEFWDLPHVGDIRQVGLIAGIEFVKDWRTREPFDLREQAGIRVCNAMAQRGVLTRPIGNVIVIMPPYCTTEKQTSQIFAALREAIRVLDR